MPRADAASATAREASTDMVLVSTRIVPLRARPSTPSGSARTLLTAPSCGSDVTMTSAADAASPRSGTSRSPRASAAARCAAPESWIPTSCEAATRAHMGSPILPWPIQRMFMGQALPEVG